MVVVIALIWFHCLAFTIILVQSVCHTLCCRQVKTKRALCYRIHIEFACSEAFLSLPSSCILELVFLSMMGHKMFPILIFYCIQQLFHMNSQDIRLLMFIFYLFYYNPLPYHFLTIESSYTVINANSQHTLNCFFLMKLNLTAMFLDFQSRLHCCGSLHLVIKVWLSCTLSNINAELH